MEPTVFHTIIKPSHYHAGSLPVSYLAVFVLDLHPPPFLAFPEGKGLLKMYTSGPFHNFAWSSNKWLPKKLLSKLISITADFFQRMIALNNMTCCLHHEKVGSHHKENRTNWNQASPYKSVKYYQKAIPHYYCSWVLRATI